MFSADALCRPLSEHLPLPADRDTFADQPPRIVRDSLNLWVTKLLVEVQ